jgi:hypothetical protein
MGPQLYIKDYMNNLNNMETKTDKKLLKIHHRKNNLSRCLNLTQTSVEDLVISSQSPVRDLSASTFLNGTESSRIRGFEIMRSRNSQSKISNVGTGIE